MATTKSTYGVTVFDSKAAAHLGLDAHVRQVEYVGNFASKAAFIRAVLLVHPGVTKSSLAQDVQSWGLRPEYLEDETIYVEQMLRPKSVRPVLLREVTGSR